MTVAEQYQAAGVIHTEDGTCPVCTGTPYNPPKIERKYLLINGIIYVDE